jgi:hypothetical protein
MREKWSGKPRHRLSFLYEAFSKGLALIPAALIPAA